MARNILVIAAHPDDEILGAGATIARHAAEGDNVSVIIAAEGIAARFSKSDESKHKATEFAISELQKCALKAAEILGTNKPIFLQFPDNRMDSIALLDVVHEFESVIKKVAPQVIYTHHGGDLNVDHQVVHKAVLTSSRPLPGCGIKAIYTFETLSSTEWYSPHQQFAFTPQRFVDVKNYFDKKMKALSAYQSELRPYPHPRSMEAVEALARTRGASVGLEMAEAFGIVRELN